MEIAAAAAGGGGGRLLFLTKPLSSAAHSRDTHQPSSWAVRTTHNLNPFFYTCFLPSASCYRLSPRFSRRDSNNEAGGGEEDLRRVGRKPNRRRWWSDKPPYLEEEEEEEEPGILEEVLDSFWIFKVIFICSGIQILGLDVSTHYLIMAACYWPKGLPNGIGTASGAVSIVFCIQEIVEGDNTPAKEQGEKEEEIVCQQSE